MLYIGIDLGTSAVKLLLMDSEGKIQNIVSREYPIYFPNPGWSEQRPEDWYEQTMIGIKELLKDADKSQVAVVLPKGTNYPLEKSHADLSVAAANEDALLTAKNKWLIGHAEGGLDAGSYIGLKGKNLNVNE